MTPEQPVASKQTYELVTEAVCQCLGLSLEIFKENQKNDYYSAYQRWLLYYFLKKNTLLSYTQMAGILNRKNHDGVGYGLQKIEEALSIRDKDTVKMVAHIQHIIDLKINNQQQWLIHSNS